ncbi:radical SAM protein [Candidatus Woesearchaeota archaeon]|nr:radical SAM protein [Candidatus Woesearchaeota archaeon]
MICKQTPFHSWCTGKLAKGCQECVHGRKLVLFITGLCAQRCFYCPVSEHKFGKDIAYANEWKIEDPKNPKELFAEIQLTDAKGVGITGGDPLVHIDRTCTYIRMLKEKYDKNFHTHLYTPLKLVTRERLQKLYDAGLDEIRLHPNLDDETLWPRLTLAREFNWQTGIEIPAIPGYEEKTKKLIDFIAGKVDFLNLNELERSDTAAHHYQLDARGYKQKTSTSYGVKGSQELALRLLQYARAKGIRAHYCTAKLKDSVQMKQRLIRRSQNAALPFDIKTDEGLLIRGCVYLPELAPGFSYKERIRNADHERTITQLEQKKKIFAPDCVIDTTKLRLILPPMYVKKNAKQIRKQGLIPAIVEEYPTADAIEANIDFL